MSGRSWFNFVLALLRFASLYDVCVVLCSHESRGNANAVNQNAGGSYDVGIWQVNSRNWGVCSGGRAPCDGATNLGCAIDVWRWGGGTFKLWSTCGGCGACSRVEPVNPKWDGSYPDGYDFTRPFPDYALHTNDSRIMDRNALNF